MVLPAQFQLGLELTNVVNPISQAMSAVGSLALIDAIKRSGSDFITETKLASLLGRHRIDPVIKFHFQEMVAKSGQSVISRYLDIILESGSGPTVQEALKNPALISMVIQLSALAFAHEDESLANAIVEAMESIVKESNADVGIVPDYVSLLGTIRACQQQTAAFRWAILYEAAEAKIRKALACRHNSRDEMVTSDHSEGNFPDSVKYRSLPLSVLQGLILWLRSLQSFPEHRLLHLRCDTGISTIVVWCHHILGLSLTIDLQGIKIYFGDAPYSLVVEPSHSQNVGVSLMDPLEPQEPLFTLHEDQNFIGISYEHRAEAYGWGAKFLQAVNRPEEELQRRAQWVILQSYTLESSNRLDYPCGEKIQSAGRFLFALDESTKLPHSAGTLKVDQDQDPTMFFLVAIVITIAMIPDDDLARCKQLPLALNIPSTILPKSSTQYPDLLQSFRILSFLLLGSHMSVDDYVEPAVLVSAWGWSVFFDSINSVDPSDVSVHTLRVVHGVPSRRGLRRTRIIDGPQSLLDVNLPSISTSGGRPLLVRGTSTAKRGVTLIGHHSDAFQVTQSFTCHHMLGQTCRYGFRKMLGWSIRSARLPSCQCDKPKRELSDLTSKQLDATASKLSSIDNLVDANDVQHIVARPQSSLESLQSADLERVFEVKGNPRPVFYVSDNPAARWLQLEVLCNDIEFGVPQYETNLSKVVLGGPNTCVECVVRNSKSFPSDSVVLL